MDNPDSPSSSISSINSAVPPMKNQSSSSSSRNASSANSASDKQSELSAQSAPTTKEAKASSAKSKNQGDRPAQPRFWTPEEHAKFLQAAKMFGYGNAHGIAKYVGTRTVAQVRTHTQKYFVKLEKTCGKLEKAAVATKA